MVEKRENSNSWIEWEEKLQEENGKKGLTKEQGRENDSAAEICVQILRTKKK